MNRNIKNVSDIVKIKNFCLTCRKQHDDEEEFCLNCCRTFLKLSIADKEKLDLWMCGSEDQITDSSNISF
jgi:hypothetical protein